MSNEVRVNAGLQIRKMDSDRSTILLQYLNQPSGFQADMTGAKGPSPGAIVCTTTGTQVDFSQLTRPTFCQITHLGRADGTDPTDVDYVQIGIWDPATRKFYPMDEVWPGETYTRRLSRNLQEIYVGPGTGTAAGGETARMMILANGASQNIKVEAFEY